MRNKENGIWLNYNKLRIDQFQLLDKLTFLKVEIS